MCFIPNFVEKIVGKLAIIVFYNFSADFCLSSLKSKIRTFSNILNIISRTKLR